METVVAVVMGLFTSLASLVALVAVGRDIRRAKEKRSEHGDGK